MKTLLLLLISFSLSAQVVDIKFKHYKNERVKSLIRENAFRLRVNSKADTINITYDFLRYELYVNHNIKDETQAHIFNANFILFSALINDITRCNRLKYMVIYVKDVDDKYFVSDGELMVIKNHSRRISKRKISRFKL